jgi:hypothetical protein
MLPEPVNSNTSQIDARVNYSAEKLRLSLAYYGSFYRNSNSTLNPGAPGALNGPLGNLLPLSAGLRPVLNLPQALAPDNQMEPVFADGQLRPAGPVPGEFQAVVRQGNPEPGLRGRGPHGCPSGGVKSGRGSRFDTGLVGPHLTSDSEADPCRPMLRYANRDDKTPVAPYTLYGTSTYTNQRLPEERTSGKLQAMYQFTSDYRGTLGVDYLGIDRGALTQTSKVAGVSALRQQTDETGINAELRRSLSQNFSGAIRVSASQRGRVQLDAAQCRCRLPPR